MANPHVRPHLHFYPEDAGKTVNEYWHAKHWHEVADPSLVTPMALVNNTRFFVYEPIILSGGGVVMPYRWFMCNGSITAHTWPLRAVKRGNDRGWIVEEFHMVIVPQGELFIPFGSWGAGQLRPLPSPKCIFGMFMPVTPHHSYLIFQGSIVLWTRTNSEIGNQWHVIAGGARHVYSFPIWLYCDDVSGNQSKRWNKHYSFLFSAAGLPCALFQYEYNVHFLCTSNIAAPLEMMDGVVSQLEYVFVSLCYRTTAYILMHCESHREAWNAGVWAWDCVLEDEVLVIPFIAALLGDNPMQSEFACHVGPGGKMLCRICNVKGIDTSTNESQPSTALTPIDDANGGRTTSDSIGASDSDGDGNSSASNTSADGASTSG